VSHSFLPLPSRGVDVCLLSPPSRGSSVCRIRPLLAFARAVVIAPHTPATEQLFRRPQLLQRKRNAYLVNVGRGAIVNLSDLTAALRAGDIAGAGLDIILEVRKVAEQAGGIKRLKQLVDVLAE
jgi:lactate dehydrogenase-like 2-hydroxyacid dehydrogenase